jgi:hypothetical protein
MATSLVSIKDWRVEVLDDVGAEVFEFDSYRDALAFAREHAVGLDGVPCARVVDFEGRFVWAADTFTELHWMSSIEGGAGFYRYCEETGWHPR